MMSIAAVVSVVSVVSRVSRASKVAMVSMTRGALRAALRAAWCSVASLTGRAAFDGAARTRHGLAPSRHAVARGGVWRGVPSAGRCLLAILGTALSLSVVKAQTATFQGIGDLPGGAFFSDAVAVSADGQVVVGSGTTASGTEAIKWSAGILTPLGDLPGGSLQSGAYGANWDGTVIVGLGRSATNDRAVRWMNGVIEELPQIPGFGGGAIARGISSDGNVIIGYNSNGTLSNYSSLAAFRFQSDALSVLPDLPGGNVDSAADGKPSADGLIIAGRGVTLISPYTYRACYWSGATLHALPPLPGGAGFSQATSVSEDGRVLVGVCQSTRSSQAPYVGEACLWRNEVPLALGDLPGGDFNSYARGCNCDGTIVVGHSMAGTGRVAFVWDSMHGMRDLRDVLTTEFGIDMTGWLLSTAGATSADGRTIVGRGTNPLGGDEGWIANVPCWLPPPAPTGPGSTAACLTERVVFSVSCGCTAPFTYAWRFNGSPIDALANPSAATATLTLTNVSAADEGAYDCVVTNACGSVTSDPATLTIKTQDYNQDGNADQDDVNYLVDVVAGAPNPGGVDPDLNGDGNIDQGDVDALIDWIAGGACP